MEMMIQSGNRCQSCDVIVCFSVQNNLKLLPPRTTLTCNVLCNLPEAECICAWTQFLLTVTSLATKSIHDASHAQWLQVLCAEVWSTWPLFAMPCELHLVLWLGTAVWRAHFKSNKWTPMHHLLLCWMASHSKSQIWWCQTQILRKCHMFKEMALTTGTTSGLSAGFLTRHPLPKKLIAQWFCRSRHHTGSVLWLSKLLHICLVSPWLANANGRGQLGKTAPFGAWFLQFSQKNSNGLKQSRWMSIGFISHHLSNAKFSNTQLRVSSILPAKKSWWRGLFPSC